MAQNRDIIADTNNDIGDLADAILEKSDSKIKGVSLKTHQKALELKKSSNNIRKWNEQSWFSFEKVKEFISYWGGVIGEATYKMATQDYVGLAGVLVSGITGFGYYREKKQKQHFANAVTDIAVEEDSNRRKEKLKTVFNKRRSDHG